MIEISSKYIRGGSRRWMYRGQNEKDFISKSDYYVSTERKM